MLFISHLIVQIFQNLDLKKYYSYFKWSDFDAHNKYLLINENSINVVDL